MAHRVDIAVQANVSFQVNWGSRWRALERSKMTPSRHFDAAPYFDRFRERSGR